MLEQTRLDTLDTSYVSCRVETWRDTQSGIWALQHQSTVQPTYAWFNAVMGMGGDHRDTSLARWMIWRTVITALVTSPKLSHVDLGKYWDWWHLSGLPSWYFPGHSGPLSLAIPLWQRVLAMVAATVGENSKLCVFVCPATRTAGMLFFWSVRGAGRVATYKAVVNAKLLYASTDWWGYATAADKQRFEAFIRRGVRLGLYQTNDPTTQLTDKIFTTISSAAYLPTDTTYAQTAASRQDKLSIQSQKSLS